MTFSAPFAKALTTTEIVQLAKPAVVLIEGFNLQTGKEQLETGFFVDPVTIVTNDHVCAVLTTSEFLEWAKTFWNNTNMEFKLTYPDENFRLAPFVSGEVGARPPAHALRGAG